MDEATRTKIQEAMEALERGEAIYESRYIVGELRGRYRGRKGEGRRVYVVQEVPPYVDPEGIMVHVELRPKET
jgi:hypothetical protein